MKKINKILIVILIFVLSFTLSSCNKEKEKLTLFSGTYAVKELTYHYFLISYVPSLELVVIDENNDNYSYYGGKGVRLSKRWKCFEFFLNETQKAILHQVKEVKIMVNNRATRSNMPTSFIP